MTIASTINRNDYVGNNTTPTYNYAFKIFNKNDLLVTQKDTNNVETTLVVDTDYTVANVGDVDGGTITLTAGNLATGYTLTIRRVLQPIQSTDIRNQGDFYPEAHENQFDKFAMLFQQQQDELNRSVKNPESISSSAFDPTLPTGITEGAGKAVIINSTNNGFSIGPTEASVAQAIATMNAAPPWYNALDYGAGTPTLATIQTAISEIQTELGAGVKFTLLLKYSSVGDWSITDNYTQPENVTFHLEYGARFSIATTKTLTLSNEPIYSRGSQIFVLNGTGTVAFGTTYTGKNNPHMYGALGDDSNDDYAAIQAAVDADVSTEILPGIYRTSATIYQKLLGKSVTGFGMGVCKIVPQGSFTGWVVGNDATSSETVHEQVFTDVWIQGGTYALQVGANGTGPKAALGFINNVKLTGASTAGLNLMSPQGMLFMNMQITGNAIGVFSDKTQPSTASMFIRCRIYQNTNQGMYLQEGWGLTFQNVNIESNGKQGVYFEKWDGVTTTNIQFKTCWFETNLTDGTTGSATVLGERAAAQTTDPSDITFDQCEFNGVTNSGSNKHIELNGSPHYFMHNRMLTPSTGSIELTTNNARGYAIGHYTTHFTDSKKVMIMEDDINIPDGDLNLILGDLNITNGKLNVKSTDGVSHYVRSDVDDGDDIIFFQRTTQASVLGVSYFACGSDTDRIGFTVVVSGVGGYRLWPDDTGDWRSHTADPTANDSGVVVGTQTFSGTHIYKLSEGQSESELEPGMAIDLRDFKISVSKSKMSKVCTGIYAGVSEKVVDSMGVDRLKGKNPKEYAVYTIDGVSKITPIITYTKQPGSEEFVKDESPNLSWDRKLFFETETIVDDFFLSYKRDEEGEMDKEFKELKCVIRVTTKESFDSAEFADKNHAVISLGDSRYKQSDVQTVGIKVCDEGGPIEAGDYLCTSSRPGYFMKQSDDIKHNYTIAKAHEDCDFTDGKEMIYGYLQE